MKSGHHGPGTLSFDVGDNGGLDPLLAAQKSGTIIPSADLDLFSDYGEGRKPLGKYLIKQIRIVAVEDVPASACGMYLRHGPFPIDRAAGSPLVARIENIHSHE